MLLYTDIFDNHKKIALKNDDVFNHDEITSSATDAIRSIVASGVDLPIKVDISDLGTSLIRIQPSGRGLHPNSVYTTAEAQYIKYLASGRTVRDYFGLPTINHVDSYSVFELSPVVDNPVLYRSVIAPTSELNGRFVTSGGGEKILVIDRSQFTQPTQVRETISNLGVRQD